MWKSTVSAMKAWLYISHVNLGCLKKWLVYVKFFSEYLHHPCFITCRSPFMVFNVITWSWRHGIFPKWYMDAMTKKSNWLKACCRVYNVDYTMLFHSQGKGVYSSAPCSIGLRVTATADRWFLSDVNRCSYWQAFLSPVVLRYIWHLSENTLIQQIISWRIVLSACLHYCQGGQRIKYCTSYRWMVLNLMSFTVCLQLLTDDFRKVQWKAD